MLTRPCPFPVPLGAVHAFCPPSLPGMTAHGAYPGPRQGGRSEFRAAVGDSCAGRSAEAQGLARLLSGFLTQNFPITFSGAGLGRTEASVPLPWHRHSPSHQGPLVPSTGAGHVEHLGVMTSFLPGLGPSSGPFSLPSGPWGELAMAS